jgi:hypothetical protein
MLNQHQSLQLMIQMMKIINNYYLLLFFFIYYYSFNKSLIKSDRYSIFATNSNYIDVF